MRMAMPRGSDSVTSVQVQILVTIVRVEPNAFAALRDDRHFLISCQLKLIFAGNNIAKDNLRFAHPARAPSGIEFSGIARQGLRPSAKPISNNIHSETS